MRRPTAALALVTALSLVRPAVAAQRPAPAPPREATPREATPASPAPQDAAASQVDADDVRTQLERLLGQYPPTLARVLRLDPTLLTDADYLQPYPALGSFIAQHPEVPHNPAFFFARYDGGNFYRGDPKDRAIEMWDNALKGFAVGALFVAIGSLLVWLVKTVIEHRRWTRMLTIQTDAHTKLLDRFTSNEDLLAYMQTPAGRRFFESAPIPVESPKALSAPIGRILWSAQVGAVLIITGIGIGIVSADALPEIAQPVAALAVIVVALGVGFGVSALMAYILSKRLGLIGDTAVPVIRG